MEMRDEIIGIRERAAQKEWKAKMMDRKTVVAGRNGCYKRKKKRWPSERKKKVSERRRKC